MEEYELDFNDETFFANSNGLLSGTRNPMLTEFPVSIKRFQRFHGISFSTMMI